MTDPAIAAELRSLRETVLTLMRYVGPRLSREQICTRLSITRTTLTRRVATGQFLRPMADGKWLLSEVVEWEARNTPTQPAQPGLKHPARNT